MTRVRERAGGRHRIPGTAYPPRKQGHARVSAVSHCAHLYPRTSAPCLCPYLYLPLRSASFLPSLPWTSHKQGCKATFSACRFIPSRPLCLPHFLLTTVLTYSVHTVVFQHTAKKPDFLVWNPRSDIDQLCGLGPRCVIEGRCDHCKDARTGAQYEDARALGTHCPVHVLQRGWFSTAFSRERCLVLHAPALTRM